MASSESGAVRGVAGPGRFASIASGPSRATISARRRASRLAWAGRATHQIEGLAVPFLGRAELVRNKKAVGRAKDLADLEALGE